MYAPTEYDDSDDGGEGLVAAMRHVGSQESRAGLKLPRMSALRGPPAGAPTADAPQADAPQADEEPGLMDLGEDNLAVRMRAGPGALQKQYQVDLGREENLADLEDKGLMEHMHRARAQLAECVAARAQLPSGESLKAGDTAARRALSALATQLKEQKMALQCASDEAHAQAANVGKLVAGLQPHGYPPIPHPRDIGTLGPGLAHLEVKMAGVIKDLGDVYAELEGFERGLTLARRDYEAVVDGLTQRAEHFEKAFEAAEALS